MRDGAADFLTKPFATDHLIAAVRRSLDASRAGDGQPPPARARRRARRGRAADRRQPADAAAAPGRSASSPRPISTCWSRARPGPARSWSRLMLHRQGPRRARPLIAVNCGALPEGLAEIELFGHAADSVPHTRLSRTGQIAASSGGTLLLDEIDSMPLAMQARLLARARGARGAADRRRAAAAGRPARGRDEQASIWREAVKAGRFRADLLYRLSIARMRVPPLRERGDDVLALFAPFASEARAAVRRGPTMRIDAATRHPCCAARLAGQRPRTAQLRDRSGAGRRRRRAAGEDRAGPAEPRRRIRGGDDRRRVARQRRQRRQAVELLGIPRKTLYDKLGRYGIDPDAFAPAVTSGGHGLPPPGAANRYRDRSSR